VTPPAPGSPRISEALRAETVEVDGRPARFTVAGSGDPVVLVHGLAGSRRWWSPLVPAFADERRVYALDLPRPNRGAPPSSWSAWLGRWLDAAELERVDVVGHSLGGIVAAELAAAYPERIRRLVLVSPAGVPCGRGLVGRALPVAGALADLGGWLPMVVGDAVRARPAAVVRAINFVWSRDLRSELSDVRAPTLLLWGDRDRLVPARVADEWHRILPASRIVYVSCGHVPMLEAPGQVAGEILAFLGQELEHDVGDDVRAGVMNGVRLAGDHDESPAR
jgi:pimeloyl-ACP methyl ester carboxylesterase